MALFYADRAEGIWHQLSCPGLPKQFPNAVSVRMSGTDSYVRDTDAKVSIPLTSCGLSATPDHYDLAAFAFPDWTLMTLDGDRTFTASIKATAF